MKKLSLNAKIYLIMSVFITGSIIISYVGLDKAKEIKTALNSLVEGPVERVARIKDMRGAFYTQVINEKNLTLEETPEGIKIQTELLEKKDQEIRKQIADTSAILAEAGKRDLATVLGLYDDYWKNVKEIKQLSLEGKKKEAFELSTNKGREIRNKIEDMVGNIVERNEKWMNDAIAEAEGTYTTARNILIFISISSILFGFVLAYFMMRAISVAINQVIANLTDNSIQVTSAAQQIASSSEELSQSATEQASSLEETASSIEEMNSMVQKNADNAKRTSDLALASSQSADRGKQVVGEMIRAIDEISLSNNTIMKQIDESNQQITDIVKVIAEIGNKTKVINDIVFQTKLLSFNASVEAARAGEHGKGFAVVAEEVGNLAQMSGNAAKEISSMLEGSIQKVEGIVEDTKSKVGQLVTQGRMKVEVGARIARECGGMLDEIVLNVQSVTTMAQEISSACQEQAQGIQEITKAMNQIDQITQTNAATSEECASAAEELSSQAESLRGVVGVLVSTIRGEGAHASGIPTEVLIKKEKASAGNVIPMKTAKATPRPEQFKQAAGGEHSEIPSGNDPRFEEV